MNKNTVTSDADKPSPDSIVLIGFRGSGKSTVGRLLSQQLGRPFIDTDVMITHAAGETIKDIFDRGGESLFRKLESEAVRQATHIPGAIISAGGGAVLAAENARRLRDCGWVIWLDAPAQVLWARINADTASQSSRPNLTSAGGLSEVSALLAQRKDIYASVADVVVAADRSPESVAAHILNLMLKRQNHIPE